MPRDKGKQRAAVTSDDSSSSTDNDSASASKQNKRKAGPSKSARASSIWRAVFDKGALLTTLLSTLCILCLLFHLHSARSAFCLNLQSRPTVVLDSDDEQQLEQPKKRKKAEPQDAEVKRLQALVVACGIRKLWAKEYDKLGLETPDQKTAHLRKLLREAGLDSDDETLDAARAIGRGKAMAKEAADLGVSVNDNADVRPARKSKTAAERRTRQELAAASEREEADLSEDDEEDAKRDRRQVDRRVDRNTDVFLAAFGLAKPPKKKSKR